MNIDKFIDDFNDCFGPPFIDEGIVKARRDVKGEGLCLQIGNRDIQFDENMKMVGRGTALTEPKVVVSGTSSVETECPDCLRWSTHKTWDHG